MKRHLQRFGIHYSQPKRRLPGDLAERLREGVASTSKGRSSLGDDYVSPVTSRVVTHHAHTETELDNLFANLAKEKDSSKLTDEHFKAVQTELLDHQKRAVAWMHARETNPDDGKLPPFWEKVKEQGRKVFYNKVTCSSTPIRPLNVRGGILADDMGLGKTLVSLPLALALALFCFADSSPPPSHSPQSILTLMAIRKEEEARASAAGTSSQDLTLIVCPLSVIQNWERQVEEHTFPGTFRIHVYHGPKRKVDHFLDSEDNVNIVMTVSRPPALALALFCFADSSLSLPLSLSLSLPPTLRHTRLWRWRLKPPRARRRRRSPRRRGLGTEQHGPCWTWCGSASSSTRPTPSGTETRAPSRPWTRSLPITAGASPGRPTSTEPRTSSRSSSESPSISPSLPLSPSLSLPPSLPLSLSLSLVC